MYAAGTFSKAFNSLQVKQKVCHSPRKYLGIALVENRIEISIHSPVDSFYLTSGVAL